MRQWEVRSASGTKDVETLLNEQEREGWSLYYFWVSAETHTFICFFYKELDQGTECKTQDTTSPSGPSRS